MSQDTFSAVRMFAVVPSDILPLTDTSPSSGTIVIGGYIKCTGTAGNVVLIDGTGQQRTYPVAAGELILAYAVKVLSTNTTATGLWCFSAQ
jgi:hypothetical protein